MQSAAAKIHGVSSCVVVIVGQTSGSGNRVTRGAVPQVSRHALDVPRREMGLDIVRIEGRPRERADAVGGLIRHAEPHVGHRIRPSGFTAIAPSDVPQEGQCPSLVSVAAACFAR